LTSGYGDFSPQTPGGRVFFVIYAFGAVPLVASFTVQAVTGLLSTYFSSGASRYGRNHDAELPTSDALKPHKYFVLKHRGQILELGLNRPETETSMDVVVDEMVAEKPPALPVTSGNVDNRQLTQELIECTIVLEAIARRLLIDSMPSNTIGRTILEADHNIQIRDVQALGGDMEILATLGRAKLDLAEDSELPVAAASEPGQALEQIRRYREMFARVLVTASTLQRLEGVERYQFERMRGEDLVSEG
jgi:potassium channel subfamily K